MFSATSFPCGCFVERDYAPGGELIEFRVQICEGHMDLALTDIILRERSENEQLTLLLPSAERVTGGEDGNNR